jgi:hypothetical protein
VRVELDSEPSVLDDVRRRRLQLEVEAVALRAEEARARAPLAHTTRALDMGAALPVLSLG